MLGLNVIVPNNSWNLSFFKPCTSDSCSWVTPSTNLKIPRAPLLFLLYSLQMSISSSFPNWCFCSFIQVHFLSVLTWIFGSYFPLMIEQVFVDRHVHLYVEKSNKVLVSNLSFNILCCATNNSMQFNHWTFEWGINPAQLNMSLSSRTISINQQKESFVLFGIRIRIGTYQSALVLSLQNGFKDKRVVETLNF